MSLTELMDLFTEMDADREARTRREQHGLGEITLPTQQGAACQMVRSRMPSA
jgi:hypothetical protein